MSDYSGIDLRAGRTWGPVAISLFGLGLGLLLALALAIALFTGLFFLSWSAFGS